MIFIIIVCKLLNYLKAYCKSVSVSASAVRSPASIDIRSMDADQRMFQRVEADVLLEDGFRQFVELLIDHADLFQ